MSPIQGVVNKWLGDRSYGFIDADDGQQIFLHGSEIARAGLKVPKAGDRLEFTTERGPRGLRAVEVRYVG
jgi:CspA family cold shock protein